MKSANGKDYYFVVFSGTRSGRPKFGARLYVTPVVVSGTTVETYGALYLWNQPESEDHHSPSWDDLEIPQIPSTPK